MAVKMTSHSNPTPLYLFKKTDWSEFVAQFNFKIKCCVEELGADKVTSSRKLALLLDTVCAETRSHLIRWLKPTALDAVDYDTVIKLLTKKLSADTQLMQFHDFVSRTQLETESTSDYISEVVARAEQISWDAKKMAILQIVRGSSSQALRNRALENLETITHEELSKWAEKLEDCESARTWLPKKDEVAVHRVEVRRNRTESKRAKQVKPRAQSTSSSDDTGEESSENDEPKKSCARCASVQHYTRACPLPWQEFQCAYCGRLGHISKACFSRKGAAVRKDEKFKFVKPADQHVEVAKESKEPIPEMLPEHSKVKKVKKHGKKHANRTDELEGLHRLVEVVSSVSAEQPAERINCLRVSNRAPDESLAMLQDLEPSIPPTFMDVLVNAIPVRFEVDNGAARSIVSVHFFEKYLVSVCPPLDRLNIQMSMWEDMSQRIQIKGWCPVKVQANGRCFMGALLVAEGKGVNILGRPWLKALNCSETVHRVSSTPAQEGFKNLTREQFIAVVSAMPAVTGEGTGCYKGTPVTISIDPKIKPVYRKARPVPLALTTRMDEAIQDNIDAGIWVPMKSGISWATPLVPVVKKGGRQLRLCADYRCTINPHLSLDSYQTPTIDEVLHRLSRDSSSCFAEIDLVSAYTQIPVGLKTSKILAVNTHRGVMRVTRLAFGTKVSPSIFQRIIDGLVGQMEGVVAYQDNVYVSARSEGILRVRLHQALRVLGDAGLRVNANKCVWYARQLQVLGFRLDTTGVHPLPDRVQAIQQAPVPANRSQLQSLLGLIAFYGRFIPDKSTMLEPLHRLLDDESQWRWGRSEQLALDQVKSTLSSDAVLVHYSSTLPVVLYVLSSEVGVAAILTHRMTDRGPRGKSQSVDRPVMFASRTLTGTERRYSLLDRESLAIHFGLTRFKVYLKLRSFEIVTTEKQLSKLFAVGKSTEDLSPRLMKTALMLQNYDYSIQFQQRKDVVPLHFLVCLPAPAQPDDIPDQVAGVHLLEAKDVVGLTHRDIAVETKKDGILRQVLRHVQKGWPELQDLPDELRLYQRHMSELSVLQDCLLMRDRVVVPASLRDRVLKMLHAAHHGERYTKALGRSLTWWPQIDDDITAMVKSCESCQLATPVTRKSVSPWPKPTSPWERVHLDYLGPFHKHHYLLAVDAFSGWPIVEMVPNLTAAELVRQVRKMFAENGICHTIVSDNGKQFQSTEFKEFLKGNAVRQLFVPVYHPASNGLAERTVQTFKQRFSKVFNGDVQAAVSRFYLLVWAVIEHVDGF